MKCRNRSLWLTITILTVSTAVLVADAPAAEERRGPFVSIGASDVAELLASLGKAEPQDGSLELVRKHVFSGRRSGPGEVLAFEENNRFVYAAAKMSRSRTGGEDDRQRQESVRLRRVLLWKPSTLVVEDVIPSSGSDRSALWMFRATGDPRIVENQFSVREGDAEIVGRTVLPADVAPRVIARPAEGDRPARTFVAVTPGGTSSEMRFLHVFHLAGDGASTGPAVSATREGGDDVCLTVSDEEEILKLTLPSDRSSAGTIEIAGADGTDILPARILPSGVMPHGTKGAELMERWDAPYRRERMPGWDVGRACTHLVKAVEDGTFEPGRAIVFGCGSGTNAIYLAKKGFEVTGVDVAPTALGIAAEKAEEAGVSVEWILADVVALPDLEPYDLVFDRGCYHHICQYDSPGYVETLRKLARTGTRAMILAGSPADGGTGGPPRIPEETISKDFSTLFEFAWLRDIQFDSRNANANGTSAWSIHLRRKDD